MLSPTDPLLNLRLWNPTIIKLNCWTCYLLGISVCRKSSLESVLIICVLYLCAYWHAPVIVQYSSNGDHWHLLKVCSYCPPKVMDPITSRSLAIIHPVLHCIGAVQCWMGCINTVYANDVDRIVLFQEAHLVNSASHVKQLLAIGMGNSLFSQACL